MAGRWRRWPTCATPIAAGVFAPAFGFGPRPEIAALTVSGSSIIVAVIAVLLKRLRLPNIAAVRSGTEVHRGADRGDCDGDA